MVDHGRRVRCVLADWADYGLTACADPPILGAVYTVVGECEVTLPMWGRQTLYVLAERAPVGGYPRGFSAEGFVPLEDAEFERLREACLTAPVKTRELAP